MTESSTRGSDISPFALFAQWYADAQAQEPSDPNAMGLGTVDADGRPSLRVVLLKDWDENGFVFYSNENSRKGFALAAHKVAALNFHWKSLGRQIRIDGDVEYTSAQEADDYFASRPRDSQIGAWASLQSQPLESRELFLQRIASYEQAYAGQPVPRPPHWRGWRIRPLRIEFWQAHEFRLHERRVFTRTGSGWQEGLLYP